MSMKLGILALACLLSLGACTARETGLPKAAETAPTGLSGADPGGLMSPREFELYTHCGVNGAMIDGQWWQISPPLDDGNGNPPHPWKNGTQEGILRFVDDDTAVFTATSIGHDGVAPNPQLVVTLHRTTSTEYPFICA